MYNFTFKDEFDFIQKEIRGYLGSKAIAKFDELSAKTFIPRSETVLHKLLADKLAIDPDGGHLSGKVGSTVVGHRVVGIKAHPLFGVGNVYWPIYAGEEEERKAGNSALDFIPTPPGGIITAMATNTQIANTAAIAACNSIVDLLDGGTVAAILRGFSGAQPAGADTAASGTLLFTLTYSDPAFGNAADAAPGATATANAIADDTSADATGTLGYCRASSADSGGVNDDIIDGEAGVSASDFNFSTLSIVAGATISMSSHTVTVPEGA
jgi:hypothetical protein